MNCRPNRQEERCRGGRRKLSAEFSLPAVCFGDNHLRPLPFDAELRRTDFRIRPEGEEMDGFGNPSYSAYSGIFCGL